VAEEQGPTREELLAYLERLSGRSLRTHEDVRAYVREISERNAAHRAPFQQWVQVKRMALAVLLAFSVLQYYVFDVVLQIAALPGPVYFVPASAPAMKSMLEALG
jgi:hypothetical protein